jgi:hypothetical protein
VEDASVRLEVKLYLAKKTKTSQALNLSLIMRRRMLILVGLLLVLRTILDLDQRYLNHSASAKKLLSNQRIIASQSTKI